MRNVIDAKINSALPVTTPTNNGIEDKVVFDKPLECGIFDLVEGNDVDIDFNGLKDEYFIPGTVNGRLLSGNNKTTGALVNGEEVNVLGEIENRTGSLDNS